jgi:hypothetical protein
MNVPPGTTLEWDRHEFLEDFARHAGCDVCTKLFEELEYLMVVGGWREAGDICRDLDVHLYPDRDDYVEDDEEQE